ncbi:MAG: helix-turn-helix domain-containing protein [bacterium]|nr:MAG: helix-turn-helix domain-containing protein [bacterium]
MILEENNSESLLTAKDVKNLLRCSLPLVYKMANRGQLPCVRWECPSEDGKRPKTIIRFKRSDVFKFIEENYVQK